MKSSKDDCITAIVFAFNVVCECSLAQFKRLSRFPIKRLVLYLSDVSCKNLKGSAAHATRTYSPSERVAGRKNANCTSMFGYTPDVSAGNGCGRKGVDRRKRKRLLAQWRLRMWGTAREAAEACTIDVSSGGFYCRSLQPFLPGDTLVALLEVPGLAAHQNAAAVVLRCHVRVLRVQSLVDGSAWGIACQIVDYSVCKAQELETIQERVSQRYETE